MHAVEVSPNGEDPELSLFSNDYLEVCDIDAAADTAYMSPKEIADLLKVSVDTVVRRFENRPGVLDLGSTESRFTRKYRVLRIPRSTFEAYIAEISVT
jgi:hypothetical protein